jgi:hypothetical protein
MHPQRGLSWAYRPGRWLSPDVAEFEHQGCLG